MANPGKGIGMDIQKLFEEKRDKIEREDKSAERNPELVDNEMYRQFSESIQRNMGNRMVEIREKYGVKPKDIIEEFRTCKEISLACLSRWESGQRGVDFIYLIWFSHRFAVDLHFLITGEAYGRSEIIKSIIKNLEDLLKDCQNGNQD